MRILVAGKRKYFTPYRNALVRSLARAGHEARAAEAPGDWPAAEAVLVIGPHDHPVATLPRGPVLGAIQTEQLPTDAAGAGRFGARWLELFREYAPRYHVVFEWHRHVYEAYRDAHPNLHFLPHGWFPELARPLPPAPAQRWDLVFIGEPTGVDDRRRRLLDRLSRRFSLYPAHSGLWGDKAKAALAAGRIALNIHFDQGRTFESPRFYLCLANGACLLSEAVHDPWPFERGRDFAEFQDPDEAEARVAQLLADPAERERLGATGRATAESVPLDDLAPEVASLLAEAGQ